MKRSAGTLRGLDDGRTHPSGLPARQGDDHHRLARLAAPSSRRPGGPRGGEINTSINPSAPDSSAMCCSAAHASGEQLLSARIAAASRSPCLKRVQDFDGRASKMRPCRFGARTTIGIRRRAGREQRAARGSSRNREQQQGARRATIVRSGAALSSSCRARFPPGAPRTRSRAASPACDAVGNFGTSASFGAGKARRPSNRLERRHDADGAPAVVGRRAAAPYPPVASAAGRAAQRHAFAVSLSAPEIPYPALAPPVRQPPSSTTV